MKPKGLLFSVVLLAVLAGVIFWSNKTKSTDATSATTKSGKDTTTKLLTIPAGDFQEIRIKKLTGEIEDLKFVDGKWHILEPKPMAADTDAITTMVTTLSTLVADKTIEDNATDLQAYGLSVPTLEVTVTTKAGKSSTMLVGDTTPTNSGAYAKMAGSNKVYTIASFIKTGLDKSANELRDKRLLTFETEKLTRVQLQAKGASMEFGKNGQGEWQILKPKPMRADGSQVDALIAKLRDEKLDPLNADADQKKNATDFAAGTRVAIATVSDGSGDQTLEVRKDKDKNFYAKSSVVEGVFKIAAADGDALDKGLEDFRNKKLFEFGFSDPGKLEVKGAMYEKNGDKWTSSGKTMDSASVQNLIDKLRDLSATKFAEAAGGTPALDVTVTSNAGKKVEKVTIRKQGADYFAQREGEPSIYQLDAKTFDDLQSAVSGVKEAAPEAPKKKKEN